MITRLLAVLIVLALSACNTSNSNTPTIPGSGTPVKALTVKGAMVSLDGTYANATLNGCRTKSGIDVREAVVISGSVWTYTRFSYSTTDGSCSAGETQVAGIVATLSSSSTGAITGWSDSGIATTAPTAADASGPLSNTESYTTLSLTATIVTGAGAYNMATAGDSINFFYIIDDTGAANILYIPDLNAANPMLSATPSGNFIKIK